MPRRGLASRSSAHRLELIDKLKPCRAVIHVNISLGGPIDWNSVKVPSKSGAIRRLVAVGAASLIVAISYQPAHATVAGHSAGVASVSSAKPPVFAYYYLWWSSTHWVKALGARYPRATSPLPLPAALDASGCGTTNLYAGNTLTDVPSSIYSQDDPGFIEADVRQAAAAGLSGFAVNWVGTGAAGQTVTSNPYSKRLQTLVTAVHKVNTEGIRFSLWLSYKASAQVLTRTQISNDLSYFSSKYGSDTAFDRSQSSKATVIWQGSRKYPVATLQNIAGSFRAKFRLLGDETTWLSTRTPYLDGDAYYWSSQDPWKNPQSFAQLATLAKAVRASPANPDGSRKVWVAPLAPGYNKKLSGGSSCVPRRGGATIKALYTGNAKTLPNAFGLISWNEISEGTYVDPMRRYGYTDLSALSPLIR